MIGYVTLGTNDIEKSCAFYDELLSGIGCARVLEDDSFVAWGTSLDEPCLSVIKPHDGNAATVGNGVMVALRMESSDLVDEFYKRAIELGATDEGAPGQRGEGFYAGYFRDLDGNKLNAFVMG